jgi:hypothetical protein
LLLNDFQRARLSKVSAGAPFAHRFAERQR